MESVVRLYVHWYKIASFLEKALILLVNILVMLVQHPGPLWSFPWEFLRVNSLFSNIPPLSE